MYKKTLLSKDVKSCVINVKVGEQFFTY